jgi:hypothetical protein
MDPLFSVASTRVAVATLQLVPQGEESGQLGLDAELERLTA